MIHFNNLILGRHESRILFMWKAENEGAVLGSFHGIKDGIEAILAREGTTRAQRAILEELRPIARNSDWDFTALKKTLLRSVKTCLP
jgi:transposase